MEDSKKILKIIENLKLQMQEQKCIYRWLEDGTIDKVVCKFNAPIELEELQKIYQKYPNIKLPESYIAFLKCSNGAQLYESLTHQLFVQFILCKKRLYIEKIYIRVFYFKMKIRRICFQFYFWKILEKFFWIQKFRMEKNIYYILFQKIRDFPIHLLIG